MDSYEKSEETCEKIEETCLELLIDGSWGVYLPKQFIDSRPDWHWSTRQIRKQCCADTIEILRAGPDSDSYWDAWEEVLNVEFVDPHTGKKITLHQDSDLWAVKADELAKFTDEEVQDFWENR